MATHRPSWAGNRSTSGHQERLRTRVTMAPTRLPALSVIHRRASEWMHEQRRGLLGHPHQVGEVAGAIPRVRLRRSEKVEIRFCLVDSEGRSEEHTSEL